MGEDDRFDAILFATKARKIRNEIVDTRHILLRKLEAKIDDVQVAIDIDDETVAAHFLKSSERIELETFASGRSRQYFYGCSLWSMSLRRTSRGGGLRRRR
jgi:hypothetical protein